MTTKQQLAWCYLNAAIAACGSASLVQIDGLLHRFCELAGWELISAEQWGRTRVAAIDGLTKVAWYFAQECEKGESCPPAT